MKTANAKFAPLYNGQEFRWDIPEQTMQAQHSRMIGVSGANAGVVPFWDIPQQTPYAQPENIFGQSGVTGFNGGLTIHTG